MHQFRLYIAGESLRTVKTVENFKAFLEDRLKDQYSLQIVDVLEAPESAQEDKIFATPTVVKVSPAPARKFLIGSSNKRAKMWEQLI